MLQPKFYLFLILCLCFALHLQASFQIQPYSVRAVSLGRAFMASADESSALFINPAGLAKMSTAEVSFIYGKLYVGLADVNLGLGSMAFLIGLWCCAKPQSYLRKFRYSSNRHEF